MIKNEIACVIVSYNIGNDIYKCYNSIKGQVDRVIIIDNGSDYETIEALKCIAKDKNSEVIFNKENLGIATALNIGVKISKDLGYKWILTMDNDSQATIGMIDSLINTYNSIDEEEAKKIVSIAVNFIESAYEDVDNIQYSNIEVSKYEYQDLVITSGNLVKSSIFDEVGYFKDEYFIDSVDHEFCLRILKDNKKIIKVQNALLKHKIGDGISKKIFFKTIHSSNHSPIRRYYITRNAMYLYKDYKNMNIKYINETRTMLLKTFIKIILAEDNKLVKLKYMTKGYLDYKRGKYGKIEG